MILDFTNKELRLLLITADIIRKNFMSFETKTNIDIDLEGLTFNGSDDIQLESKINIAAIIILISVLTILFVLYNL